MIAARRICLSLLVLVGVACYADAEIHTWTDSTGKYKTEAEFVSLVDDVVTLRKKNGKEVKLSLKRLSTPGNRPGQCRRLFRMRCQIQRKPIVFRTNPSELLVGESPAGQAQRFRSRKPPTNSPRSSRSSPT